MTVPLHIIGNGFIGKSYADAHGVAAISAREAVGTPLRLTKGGNILFAAGITRLTRNDKELIPQARRLMIWTVDELRRACPRHIIMLSTIDVYGTSPGIIGDVMATAPADHYSESQLFMEQLLQEGAPTGTTVSIMRLSGIYGLLDRRTSIISKFFAAALSCGTVTIINGGCQLRDWMWIDTLMGQMDAVFTSRLHGIYNVGTGDSMPVSRYAEIVAELTSARIVDVPQPQDTSRATDIRISGNLLAQSLSIEAIGHKTALTSYYRQLLEAKRP